MFHGLQNVKGYHCGAGAQSVRGGIVHRAEPLLLADSHKPRGAQQHLRLKLPKPRKNKLYFWEPGIVVGSCPQCEIAHRAAL